MSDPISKKALFWGRRRIGDVVMSIPALKLIRKHAPALSVRYVTTFYSREVIELTGLVDDVRCYHMKGGIWNFFRWFKLRREVQRGDYEHIFVTGKASRYRRKIGDPSQTSCIDSTSDGHTAERCARTVIKGLNLEVADIPSTAIDLADDPKVKQKFRNHGLSPDKRYLTIHAACNRVVRGKGGDQGSEKLWPSDKYIPLLTRLRDKYPDLQIVLAGTEEERPWIQEQITDQLPDNINPLNLAGHTSIKAILQLLRHSDVLLSGDSGVMHLATMSRTPMVVLFGPTNESRTGPFSVDDQVIELRAVPYPEAIDDPFCMEKITVDDVFNALVSSLE